MNARPNCPTCGGTILARAIAGTPRGTCTCQRRQPTPWFVAFDQDAVLAAVSRAQFAGMPSWVVVQVEAADREEAIAAARAQIGRTL